MSISIGGALITEWATVANNSITTVFTATRRTPITSVIVTETNGGTPTLTLARYDGAARKYLRKAVAMVAGMAFVFDTPFVLDPGNKLEVTSSDASGHMDVAVTYVNPVAPASGRAP